MCRLLFVKSDAPVSMQHHLEKFAQTAKNSPEDQSHGWGCAWLEAGNWHFYHSIHPIWEDRFERFEPCDYFLAHARSAYRNEGIEVRNNMPFDDGERVFIFNGELQGVRIREAGRIGAERVFNFIKRFDIGDMESAIQQGIDHLVRKSRYVRAMNFIIATANEAWVSTTFNENPEYFQLHTNLIDGTYIVSSAPYEKCSDWTPIENYTITRVLRSQ